MGIQPNGGKPTTNPTKRPQAQNAVLMILGDIADTAWRMFIPTIGATLLGLYVDKLLGTTPWLMITLMILGTGLAGLLVRRQLTRVSKN
ncbi:MAG TPA: AtpZ/AtpI family protein [Patescibacteria group bacterium]|nr:AtpZ/AtpI family protein [Patescibacteria group bacterium]